MEQFQPLPSNDQLSKKSQLSTFIQPAHLNLPNLKGKWPSGGPILGLIRSGPNGKVTLTKGNGVKTNNNMNDQSCDENSKERLFSNKNLNVTSKGHESWSDEGVGV